MTIYTLSIFIYCQACTKAGKHIFCEKPISLSLEGTVNVIKLVRDSGVKFMTAFNRRYDSNFARMHQVKKPEGGESTSPMIDPAINLL